MPKRTLESLGALVKAKRGTKKLRESSREIGIGPATLLRVESGRTPDLGTFALICKWLGINPSEFLGFKETNKKEVAAGMTITAHFRAKRELSQDTQKCLAEMIAYAARIQPEPGNDPNGKF